MVSNIKAKTEVAFFWSDIVYITVDLAFYFI